MTTVPTIGILALQGDVREHARALESAGARTVRVRRPEELERIDGLVIPGGESTTMIKLAAVFDLLEPLRKRIEGGLPAYGSCAGMIMLADRIEDGVTGQQTIGGIDMTVRRNAFGRQVDSFESPVPMPEVGGAPFHAVFIRAPWVESVGDGVQVLGRAEGGPEVDRIVAVRQGRLMATAFHPELTGDHRVHHYFADLVRRATEEE
ncbi:pyridoxal 5'-phosphate synthase glutaminase subunit PdxT [Actinomadura flavalba]|uniref:pyridoxal 5'-phosphate synthase glutaminase subunit PdxT n=1 Tax=Actinomadura flavalba TaxID=1120938 RepID=UPI00036EEF63|nr:pyridoxal 5'-phosphate synthase glutaminase subunit PdxT [Actinomadura flavalba]